MIRPVRPPSYCASGTFSDSHGIWLLLTSPARFQSASSDDRSMQSDRYDLMRQLLWYTRQGYSASCHSSRHSEKYRPTPLPTKEGQRESKWHIGGAGAGGKSLQIPKEESNYFATCTHIARRACSARARPVQHHQAKMACRRYNKPWSQPPFQISKARQRIRGFATRRVEKQTKIEYVPLSTRSIWFA